MTKQLGKKKDAILALLKDVHGDTSGPAQNNLDAVREIIETAREIEAALKIDCGEPE